MFYFTKVSRTTIDSMKRNSENKINFLYPFKIHTELKNLNIEARLIRRTTHVIINNGTCNR